jgi:hypothetical protein
MASSSLRRTKIPGNGHRFEELAERSSDDFTLTSIDQQAVQSLCDQYPFDGQTIYRGTIQYQEQAELGGGRDIELQFEFRDQSSLFILESDVDIPSIESVIKRLNTLSPNEFIIYRSLTVHRERLWTFLQEADQFIDATLVSKHGETMDLGEYNLESPRNIQQHPIESATIAFEYGGEQIVTRYTDGTLSIHSDNPEAREYIIQLFERDVLAVEG